MRIDILTLFPGYFEGVLRESILGSAIERGLLEVHLHDFREFSEDKHGKVDDRPYGGGPGMVLKPGPIFRAVEAIRDETDDPGRLILLTPQGERLNDARVRNLAESAHLILVCGRYEGFDERVRIGLSPEELSIGDYVLSGGEPAAAVLVDAVSRLLPGSLGHEESAKSESFAAGLLEHPQYTRPPEFRGMAVPDVLLSGDHGRIARWRNEQALARTKERRHDLLETQPQQDEQNDA